jgi:hypothetical protein
MAYRFQAFVSPVALYNPPCVSFLMLNCCEACQSLIRTYVIASHTVVDSDLTYSNSLSLLRSAEGPILANHKPQTPQLRRKPIRDEKAPTPKFRLHRIIDNQHFRYHCQQPPTSPPSPASFTKLIMAPKRILVERSGPRSSPPKGFFGATYNMLTSSENAPIVRSIGVFGVRMALQTAQTLDPFSTDLRLLDCRCLPLQLLGRHAVAPVSPSPSPFAATRD